MKKYLISNVYGAFCAPQELLYQAARLTHHVKDGVSPWYLSRIEEDGQLTTIACISNGWLDTSFLGNTVTDEEMHVLCQETDDYERELERLYA